jgi:hypothetical protein
MSAYRKILIVCFVLFLSSCTSFKPVLTAKNADMSREIKQKAPKVSKVDISPDGRYVLSGAPDPSVSSSLVTCRILSSNRVLNDFHLTGIIAYSISNTLMV